MLWRACGMCLRSRFADEETITRFWAPSPVNSCLKILKCPDPPAQELSLCSLLVVPEIGNIIPGYFSLMICVCDDRRAGQAWANNVREIAHRVHDLRMVEGFVTNAAHHAQVNVLLGYGDGRGKQKNAASNHRFAHAECGMAFSQCVQHLQRSSDANRSLLS